MKEFIKTKVRKFLNETYDSKFPDDYDLSKHNFNLGDCDVYAVSLHRLYNYPLYAIRGKFLEPEWGGKREWDYEYSHIMVKLPNGNYMDSDGEQTKQEMISRAAFSEDIKKIEIIQIDEETALNMFSCQDQEKDIERVMNYIKNKSIPKSLDERVETNMIKYSGKLSDKEIDWLEIRGRASYSGGVLTPIFFNDTMIGGISWNLGGIDYIELLPKYKNKGYLKYIVYDNADKNNEVGFVTASDELTKKLENYGTVSYDQNTDITTVKLNK